MFKQFSLVNSSLKSLVAVLGLTMAVAGVSPVIAEEVTPTQSSSATEAPQDSTNVVEEEVTPTQSSPVTETPKDEMNVIEVKEANPTESSPVTETPDVKGEVTPPGSSSSESPSSESPSSESPSSESSTPGLSTPESPSSESSTPESPSSELSTPESPSAESSAPGLSSPSLSSPKPSSPGLSSPSSPTPESSTPESSTSEPSTPTLKPLPPGSSSPKETPQSGTKQLSAPGSSAPESPAPDAPAPESSSPTEDPQAGVEMNVVETAMAAGSFQTLVAAIKAAGLVETLSGEGPFTIFAPTDEAFAALGQDKVEELLKPENKDKLVAILTYHVVPGMVKSTDLQSGQVKTVEGSAVTIKLGDSVKANDATVIKADLEASNGVIHVVDQVILPPDQ